jgi:predicted Zn-dependent peptidase
MIKEPEAYKQISENPCIYRVNFPQKTDDIYVDISYDVGDIFVPAEFKGYAHAFEHYVLGCIQKKHGDELHRMNGEAGHDSINFNFVSDKGKVLEHLKIFLDEIYRNRFTEKHVFEYERASMESEFRESWNHIGNQVTDMVSEKIYAGDCPYFVPLSEEISAVSHMRFDYLPDFFNNFFSHLKPFFVYGGYNLDEKIDEEIVKLVQSYSYGTMEAKTVQEPVCVPQQERFFAIQHPSVQYGNFVRVYFPGFGMDRRVEDRIALAFLCEIFGGGSVTGIFKKIRSLGIYSFGVRRRVFEKFGFIEINSFITPEQTKEFFEELYAHVELMQKELVPHNELRLITERNKRNVRENWLSNSGRYGSIYSDIVNGIPIYTPETYGKVVDSITSEQLRDLARECFNMSEIRAAIIGSAADEKLLSFVKSKTI